MGVDVLSDLSLKQSLQYTQTLLDRSDHYRRSPEKIAELREDPACRVFPVYQSKHLFINSVDPVVAVKSQIDPSLCQGFSAFLGIKDDTPYFSVSCNDSTALAWTRHYPESCFTDLRSLGGTLQGSIASILAYSRGLDHWHSNNCYCSKCGGKTRIEAAGHMMKCQACGAETFPRTDPAVIMLVEHCDSAGHKRCLLGRSPAWPEGCYSTLAGFVETGESIESAVIREVFEETAITVSNPVYVTSQPWPFPQSLMLGFTATAEDADILLDQHELADAKWYSVEEIASFGEWADDSSGPKLPRVDSIARFLIDNWVSENVKTR